MGLRGGFMVAEGFLGTKKGALRAPKILDLVVSTAF